MERQITEFGFCEAVLVCGRKRASIFFENREAAIKANGTNSDNFLGHTI
jgi:hypothetical protein